MTGFTMNLFTLATCFAIVLGAVSANPAGEEDRQMVFVGMMDGFIVLDEQVMKNQSKLPEPKPLTHPNLPQLITGSRPEIPEGIISTSNPKLPGRPVRPSTIKLPPLIFAPQSFQNRPYRYPYPYGSLNANEPQPYTAPGGYGSQFGQYSYAFHPNYPMMQPGSEYGLRPTYGMLPPRPSYGFQTSYPTLPSRPFYGFRPYEKDEIGTYDQAAKLQYADSE